MSNGNKKQDIDVVRARFLKHCVLNHGLLGCWSWRDELEVRGKFYMYPPKQVEMAHRAAYSPVLRADSAALGRFALL